MRHIKHRNPNTLTTVIVDKVSYRDAKRIKLKLTLVSPNGYVIESRKNYTVKPDWFENFVDINDDVGVMSESEETTIEDL